MHSGFNYSWKTHSSSFDLDYLFGLLAIRFPLTIFIFSNFIMFPILSYWFYIYNLLHFITLKAVKTPKTFKVESKVFFSPTFQFKSCTLGVRREREICLKFLLNFLKDNCIPQLQVAWNSGHAISKTQISVQYKVTCGLHVLYHGKTHGDLWVEP